MLVKHVWELIGRTPLLEIDPKVHGLKNFNLYAKLEHLNPFGSVKDRPAWNILEDSLATLQQSGKTVIESSSGNMAKAMQVICSMHGVPFKVVSNRIQVKEVKQILQLLGAEVSEFPGLSSCPDPSDPNNPIAQIEREIAAEPDKYLHTSQYTNESNTAAHSEHTGPEIIKDLGGKVDYFIVGLGTTGSSRGAGEYLKAQNPALTVVGVVAKKGQLVPGIRNADEMFEVGLFKKDFYDRIVEVDVDTAIDGTLTMARKLGVLAGPSSGAAFAACVSYLKSIDAEQTSKRNAVFIVSDRLEWYLSYLQKYRPQLFGISARKESARHVSDEMMAGAKEISVEEAQKWLAETAPRTLVVDLRGSLAFKAGRVAGSINLPIEHLEELSEWGVPFSTQQRVLFLCPVGDQSKRFAAYFSHKGIDCGSLKGGFIAWRDAGKPIERAAVKK